ncbi:flagellar biosynthetic protein FliR [Natranaerovirga pectinivora]|uniref:Flagellar biosynthetic protein FliR n=1 Tax=Natranaerovirga pectinivora TaxID=682400 RepID=A0A4R3MKK9_9FIRM|nr:flagellar biosynthetic protein FliR [Natranaerovirga pectinivora]TCT15087.1 flagellar biosynthetic protein FliR [Natranaerovirga pectinivora]
MEQFINPFFQLDIFLLMLIRMVSFISVVPLFGIKNIPVYAKIGLAFFLTLILFNLVPIQPINYFETVIGYAFFVMQEIFVGWLIGFGVFVTFSIINLAGQLIDHNIGFAMVNVFDPLSQVQLPVTANFYYYIFLLLLITTNMHFYILQGIIESFKLIPIGGVSVNPALYTTMINFITDYFVIAFKISSPIFAGILIVNVILGILARTVPQMNMFVVGLPLKLIIGLTILLITIGLMPAVGDFIFYRMIQTMDQLIRGMMP